MLGKLEARAARREGADRAARSGGSRPRTPASTATRSVSRRRGGLPESFADEVARRDGRAGAPLRPHPRSVPDRAAHGRYGVDPMPALRELERSGDLVRGELLPGGTEREWCDADVLRRVRRASLAHLRKEAEAVDQTELARFLPDWQNVDAHRPAGAGPDRLREALVALQGVALTPEVWERDVLPRRLGAYSQGWLDELTTGGEIVWIGAGPLAPLGPRGPLLPRGRPPGRAAARQREARGAPRARSTTSIRERLAAGAVLLARPRRRARGLAGGAPRGALGPGLGGRGDQRRVRAAARPPALGRPARRVAGQPALRVAPGRCGRHRPGSLVADRIRCSRERPPRDRGCGPRPS